MCSFNPAKIVNAFMMLACRCDPSILLQVSWSNDV